MKDHVTTKPARTKGRALLFWLLWGLSALLWMGLMELSKNTLWGWGLLALVFALWALLGFGCWAARALVCGCWPWREPWPWRP
ncbi:MAG: hypothetical protein IKS05_06955 [Oscillospiraceae bacterium]|nr:hypothetical protein [Oscillospiraceae bacterium]